MARIKQLTPAMWRALVKIADKNVCDFRSSNALVSRGLIKNDGAAWYVPTAHGWLTLAVVRASIHQFELVQGCRWADHLKMALAALAVAEKYGVPSR